MKVNIDSQAITLTCPTCKKKFDEKIGRLKKNPTLTCPGCKGAIQIKADELRRATDTVQKSLDKLTASLGNLR
jgi:DNA-directed RNA polymerase subunit RPC12/RpoP